MFLDFHTHKTSSNANLIKLTNIDVGSDLIDEDFFNKYDQGCVFSAGIHPWSIDAASFFDQLEVLEYLLKKIEVKTLGECGLDKIKGPEFKLQEEIFIKQIRLAERYKKPMVIHCVKSFSELLAIKKIIRPKVPMVIHGFNKKPELAAELTLKGFYLSFGYSLIENPKMDEVLKATPLGQVFFETDNIEQLEVTEIYNKAAQILKMDLKELEETIYNNYLELFL
jgi:TatD DNase family protein